MNSYSLDFTEKKRMFSNISMTGTGLLVVIITWVLGYFGIIPADGQILQYISDFATMIGWILTIWGQIRRNDLSMGLFRL